MFKFLIRRIVLMALTMFIVSIAVFALTELAPGNIAINTLGNLITKEQEQAFNAQNGFDAPAWERYTRWMVGSDWQAERLIGRPVTRLIDKDNQRHSWWIVDADGSLYQNYTTDSETIIKTTRQSDGTLKETPLGPEVWQTQPDGTQIYWGVDAKGHAVVWVRGKLITEWTLRNDSGNWGSTPGAPLKYIPLQQGLLRGDPGVSFLTRRPVAETLFRRLQNTAILTVLAFAFIMPLSLLLGLLAGLNEGQWIDRVLSIGGLITTATPEFVSGVLLILVFSTWLGWLPGAVVLSSDTALFENPAMLVLPLLTLTLVELGYVLRITRASMVEVMRTNYIRTAVLKGLPRFRIVFKHAIRNALMAPITARPSPWVKVKAGLELLTRSKIALVGLGLVLFWVVVALFADDCIVQPACWTGSEDYASTPWLAVYSPDESTGKGLSGPSPEHWLGTDRNGRDLWARLAHGARIILTLAPLGVGAALLIGGVLGLIAGYFGGWVDEVVMRLLDAVIAFPQIILYMVIIAALGPSATNVVLAITIAGAPGIARLVRSLALDIKTRDYVAAAQTRGESPWYIMFVEILPNASGPIIIDAMLRIGYAVFAIGTLGFLGLGLPPPSPDWGSIVNVGRKFIQAGHPWDALWASAATAMLVVGLNLLADGLNEELQRYR